MVRWSPLNDYFEVISSAKATTLQLNLEQSQYFESGLCFCFDVCGGHVGIECLIAVLFPFCF